MLLLTFSGTAVLLGLGALCLAVGGTILVLRLRLRDRATRNAAFSFTTPLHRLSLCVAIAAAVLCLNWTQYEPEQTVYMVGVAEDIIETNVPITKTPPPPPPPPPPPVIEAVEEPIIDTMEFTTMAIDEADEILAPPTPIAPAAPPPASQPPPPLPPEVEDNPEPILFAERMPVFGNECFTLDDEERKACSDRALLQFVQSRANYPALARENGIEGTVVIAFTVETDGTVTDVEAIRKIGGGCTESAQKAVEAINLEGQKFQPGRQAGRLVRVRFNLPVKFKLE